MKRAVLALLVAVLLAAALIRRRAPTYATWDAYLADAEGDAIEPLFV